MDTVIQETLEELLNRLSTPFRKIRIEKKQENIFRVNIESEEPSLLIGHHGENIFALQNILRTIVFKKHPGNYSVILDVDDYRKRQEENIVKLAERKAEIVRKTGQTQSLPPMSPYFRRIVHLHLAKPEFANIETESVGEGDFRHITIKQKSQQA